LLDPPRINIKADCATIEHLNGGNQNAPVSTAQIVQEVILSNSGQFQHLNHDVVGSGNEKDFRDRKLNVPSFRFGILIFGLSLLVLGGREQAWSHQASVHAALSIQVLAGHDQKNQAEN
jgi:hypothetical protein